MKAAIRLLLMALLFCFGTIHSFSPPNHNNRQLYPTTPSATVPKTSTTTRTATSDNENDNDSSSSSSSSSSYSSFSLRRDIKVPLLDIPDPSPQEGGADDDDEKSPLRPRVVLPLPSDHLPDELRDLNVYGMELKRPVHKLIMEDAVDRAGSVPSANKPIYGHLAFKPNNDESLVGAIGTVSEIILHTDGDSTAALMGGGVDQGTKIETEAQDVPKTIVSCGAFRFVVKEVIQSVPYPVVIVDELPDNEPGGTTTSSSKTSTTITSNQEDEDDEDDDDDDDDMYSDLDPPEMMKELFRILQTYVDQKLEEADNHVISPLEKAILEETGNVGSGMDTEKIRAEQLAATLITFRTGILDIAPTPTEGYFAISFLAAEIVDLSNEVRRKMLTMLDGAERLRFVLNEVNHAVGMARARKMAKQITDSNDESDKDLKIGTPELPPWSKQIRKGQKVAYYWNEEWEWCEAEVIEDPVMVVDELLVTVRFEDGEVHKLPFHPDEKARWRPGKR